MPHVQAGVARQRCRGQRQPPLALQLVFAELQQRSLFLRTHTHARGEDKPAAVLCGMGGVMPWRRTILALSFNRRRRAFLLSVASCVGSVRWRFVPRRLPLPAPPPLPAFSSSWALAAATSTPRKPRHFAEPQRHRSSSFVLNYERIQVESGVGQSVSTGFYATW